MNKLRALCALFAMASMNVRAELVVTVTEGQVGAQPIAVAPFASDRGEPPGDFAAVVEADLARSGLFKPLPRADMLETPNDIQTIEYRNWRLVNVDYLVVGKLTSGTGGKQRVVVDLLDIALAKSLLSFELPVSTSARWRSVAHKISDRIYEKLTGTPGAFDTQIAYVTASGSGRQRQFQIIIADADGANPVTVASSREPLLSPSWSPDRKKLAYVGFERSRSAIFIHTLATGELKKISSEKGINGAPAWSPDGLQLAVTLSFESNSDIYILSVGSGQRRRLTEHFAIDTEPAWSPDGKEIAFTSDRGGRPQIYTVSSSGGAARRLTYEGRENLCPTYSADGNSLLLVNQDELGYRIGVLDLKTRGLRILSKGPLDESPSFSPNDAIIIYAAQGRGSAELATVSADGRVRQRLSQSGDVRDPAWSSR